MESAGDSETYLATKVLGKVLHHAGSSACGAEQGRYFQQFGVHPPHQDLSIEAAGE
jgi:hypothetical protein